MNYRHEAFLHSVETDGICGEPYIAPAWMKHDKPMDALTSSVKPVSEAYKSPQVAEEMANDKEFAEMVMDKQKRLNGHF